MTASHAPDASPQQSPERPFEQVEALLADPPADGAFVHHVAPDGDEADAPLRLGDVVLDVDDAPATDVGLLLRALQPRPDEEDPRRRLRLLRDGAEATVEVAPSVTRGVGFCAVRAHQPAWESLPDSDYAPALDALTANLVDGEHWLSNHFGDELAGFERFRLTVAGEGDDARLHSDVLFRLGGEHEGGTWGYRTRLEARHRLDRALSVERTAFWEGMPGEEQQRGPSEIAVPGVITGYTIRLVPLTMPLEAGARLTVLTAPDGADRPTSRSRIECAGRETVTLWGGEQAEAWCFRWRHYGYRTDEEDERFYVSDDRRLVRIDWGVHYQECWSVAAPKDELLAQLPPFIEVR